MSATPPPRVADTDGRASERAAATTEYPGGAERWSGKSSLVWCQVSVSVNTSSRRFVMTSDSATDRSVTEHTFSNPRRMPVYQLIGDVSTAISGS